MPVAIVFETHSTCEDNERRVASGWRPSGLSAIGRRQAAELGERRRTDGLVAVFSSDLRRATETATIAFEDSTTPLLFDWRLRECDYGECEGVAFDTLARHRFRHVDDPYPAGESWRSAVDRVNRSIDDIATQWSGGRVLVIGHVATRWALEHRVNRVPLERLAVAEFQWRPGWEYALR